MELANALRGGNRRALAKAITLVESSKPEHIDQAQNILEQLLPYTGNSFRLGITGVPGVGKSSFIEVFGLYLLSQGKRVAVLAVDPSSPLAGGSILGDKTRMETLSRQSDAFIRPSPAAGALGGVANKTRETMLLCEAAGYDVIVVETVGVGQSEHQVAQMVDFFLVLMLPNAGDELQGIKRGIMELADALLVNKADGDSLGMAAQTQAHYQSALQFLSRREFWTPQVMTCSALENRGIDSIWEMLCQYRDAAQAEQHWARRRARQNTEWLRSLVHELLEQRLNRNPEIKARRPELERQVAAGETTAYKAAQALLALL